MLIGSFSKKSQYLRNFCPLVRKWAFVPNWISANIWKCSKCTVMSQNFTSADSDLSSLSIDGGKEVLRRFLYPPKGFLRKIVNQVSKPSSAAVDWTSWTCNYLLTNKLGFSVLHWSLPKEIHFSYTNSVLCRFDATESSDFLGSRYQGVRAQQQFQMIDEYYQDQYQKKRQDKPKQSRLSYNIPMVWGIVFQKLGLSAPCNAH